MNFSAFLSCPCPRPWPSPLTGVDNASINAKTATNNKRPALELSFIPISPMRTQYSAVSENSASEGVKEFKELTAETQRSRAATKEVSRKDAKIAKAQRKNLSRKTRNCGLATLRTLSLRSEDSIYSHRLRQQHQTLVAAWNLLD